MPREFGLRLFARGDVLDDPDEVQRFARFVAHQRYCAVGPEHAAVLGDIALLLAEGPHRQERADLVAFMEAL